MTSDWTPISGETPMDPSDLKVRVNSRAELNALEFQNITRAITRYLAVKPGRRMAPFTVQWCRRLHREMFGEVMKSAGEFRRTQTNIGVVAGQIEVMLHGLLSDLAHWSGRPMIEQAADLHYRAVCIHPFTNGNGRWSRLLANIWLRRHDHPLVYWPEQVIGHVSPIRDEYLADLRAADAGDLKPLIALHARYTVESHGS